VILPEDILKSQPYSYEFCVNQAKFTCEQLKTFEELESFRKAKGYKFGWTIYRCHEKDIEI
jgi:hypothetical protein